MSTPISIDPEQVFYLSPQGDDSEDGSRLSPWRSWDRALEQDRLQHIILLKGSYPPAAIRPHQALRISSEELVTGDLEISGNSIELYDFQLKGHLKISQSESVGIKNATIECQENDCVSLQESRLFGTNMTIRGGKKVVRNLLIESSTVSLTKVQITSGGNYAQILGRKKSIIRLNDVHLRRSLGIGISCSSGSRLVLQNARITGARKYNLLASEAEMEVKTSTLGSTQNLGIGLQGAKMRVVNTTMQPSPFGVISLISKGEIRSSVLIAESLIHHGTHYGIMVAGGEAVIRNSSFKGSVNTQKIGDDSILVTGAYSSITLTDTRVLDSAGFGIALYEGAFGRISGEISRPRLGGILVHSKTSEQVVIKNTSIQNAKLGPGIVALAGNTTEIEEVEVRNCHGGGVLVGQEAVARIEKSKFHQNKGYDLSAYGQAHVTAIDLQLRDVENLSFASCAENAQIEFVSTQEAVAAKGHHGTRWFCP